MIVESFLVQWLFCFSKETGKVNLMVFLCMKAIVLYDTAHVRTSVVCELFVNLFVDNFTDHILKSVFCCYEDLLTLWSS